LSPLPLTLSLTLPLTVEVRGRKERKIATVPCECVCGGWVRGMCGGETVGRVGSVESAGIVRGSGERGARGGGVFDGGASAWWAGGGAERVVCGVCEVLRVGLWVRAGWDAR
jgi:hypothetical protein